MIERPGTFPDIRIFPHDLPKSWNVPIKDVNGMIDLSGSTVTVVVQDDGDDIGTLTVDMTNAADGVIRLTADQTIYDAMALYATWRLRETPTFDGELVVQGRLVKEG